MEDVTRASRGQEGIQGGGGSGGDVSTKPKSSASGKAGRRSVVVERTCDACAFTGEYIILGVLNYGAHAKLYIERSVARSRVHLTYWRVRRLSSS